MLLMVLLLLAGLGALYFGADWMVRGAARLGKTLGLSPMVIGLTVVSLGTSAPELFVAVMATLQGSSDIAVGNVLGSNLANIGLIMGLTAVVRPLQVAPTVIRREIPIMVFVTVLLGPLIMDRAVGRMDGALLTGLLALYLIFLFYRGRKTPAHLISPVSQLTATARDWKRMGVLVDLGLLVAGTLGLLLGGRAIVQAGIYFSEVFGISELAIGLTVVAVGTSLPELATSIVAAMRKQTDIAVGNVIGSNIFNIAGVLGITGILAPIDVDPGVLWVEFPAVLGLSLVLFLVSFSPKARGEGKVQRWEGALLLVAYVALGTWILW